MFSVKLPDLLLCFVFRYFRRMAQKVIRQSAALFRLGALSCLLVNTVQAADIVAHNPVLESDSDGYMLSADFDLNFNPRLEEAINKGVALSFSVDFELIKPRWYWFDEETVNISKPLQLSYHALTRQYRLSSGGLSQGFSSLESALRVMTRLRRWRVLDDKAVQPGRVYQAAVRMRFDLTQLPKTFQVSALSSRDWNLTSEWTRWPFSPVKQKSDVPQETPSKENPVDEFNESYEQENSAQPEGGAK